MVTIPVGPIKYTKKLRERFGLRGAFGGFLVAIIGLVLGLFMIAVIAMIGVFVGNLLIELFY